MVNQIKHTLIWIMLISIGTVVASTLLLLQSASSSLKVEAPEWEISGKAILDTHLQNWIDNGRVSYADGESIPEDTDLKDIIKGTTLLLDGNIPISHYVDNYVRYAGEGIKFQRIIKSRNRYTVTVTRKIWPIVDGINIPDMELRPDTLLSNISYFFGWSYPDHRQWDVTGDSDDFDLILPAPRPFNVGNTTYTAQYGVEITTFKLPTDPCLPPGNYIYKPEGTYRLNILKYHSQYFPPVWFTILPDKVPKPYCMSERSYANYYKSL